MKFTFKPLCSLLLTLTIWSTGYSQGLRFPLSTEGRHIVDADRKPVLIKAVNWYGANLEGQVVQGLDKQGIEHIVGLIQRWGFNAVRLPFSNAMLHDTRAVDPERIRANPQFMGLTPLQIYDATVAILADAGIAIMLNDHSSSSEWCCNFDTNGLWYHSGLSGYNLSESQWIEDWKMLAARYRNIKAVVGADLRNEVRTAKLGGTFLPNSPNWGDGGANDWHRAAQRAGNDVLSVNPDLLIIVEGINWTGALSFLGGYRPHLRPVADAPIHLVRPDKLVYAAHNYGYIGPKHNGDSKTSPGQSTYAQMDEESFRRAMDEEWGYVLQAGQYYQAPVILSEFGVHQNNPSDHDRAWFQRISAYLAKNDIGFAYWPLNGEGYGLVDENWSRILDDDWRASSLKDLLENDFPGEVKGESRFYNLSLRRSDDRLSAAFGDWLPGAFKGLCEEGTRLNGLSQDKRGLCNDTHQSLEWDGGSVTSLQAIYETTTRFHGTVDWARGFTKYECPKDFFAIGFSKHSWGSSGLLCAKSSKPLGSSCRTLWFDRGDARASLSGGDWARGSYKGQCADDEYLGGLAQRNGSASAILCCSMQR